jgi:hypothetical protein
MSTSSRKSKRSGASTNSTGHSPEKKSTGQGKSKTKNPIVKVLDKIATTYTKSVATNHQTIQEHNTSAVLNINDQTVWSQYMQIWSRNTFL